MAENKDLIDIKFSIWGQEYHNLKKWAEWKEEQAFTGRYEYRFSTSSIGIGTHVYDLEHDISINITDYDSW